MNLFSFFLSHAKNLLRLAACMWPEKQMRNLILLKSSYTDDSTRKSERCYWAKEWEHSNVIKCQWQYMCHQEIKFVDLFSSASLCFFFLFAAAVVDRDFWVRSVLRESVLFNMDEHSPSILCRPWCLQAAKR